MPNTMDNKEYSSQVNDKIRLHRLLKLFRNTIAVLMLMLMIVFLYNSWVQNVYESYEIKVENHYTKSTESIVRKFGDSLLIYSQDGMNCVDSKGKTVWNQTYEIQNPIIKMCDNVVAVADYNGKDIYVASTNKILGTISTTMPIRDFCVSANGIVAAVLDDSPVTGIYLFDSSGKNLVYLKTAMSNSGYPVALDLSKDGKQMAISYLSAEAGEIITNIAFYNFSEVGKNYTDNLVGAYGYKDLVVPMIRFMENGTCFAIGDKKLMFFKGEQIPINTNDIGLQYDINSVFYDDNYVGIVSANSSGETNYLLQVYNKNGELAMELPFDMEYKDIRFMDSGVVIYNDMECQIYNWKKYLKYEGLFQNAVITILDSGSIDRHIIVTQDAIQSIQLK